MIREYQNQWDGQELANYYYNFGPISLTCYVQGINREVKFNYYTSLAFDGTSANTSPANGYSTDPPLGVGCAYVGVSTKLRFAYTKNQLIYPSHLFQSIPAILNNFVDCYTTSLLLFRPIRPVPDSHECTLVSDR